MWPRQRGFQKAAILLLFPGAGLKSMALAEEKPARMYGAAIMLLIVGVASAWAFFRNSMWNRCTFKYLLIVYVQMSQEPYQ